MSWIENHWNLSTFLALFSSSKEYLKNRSTNAKKKLYLRNILFWQYFETNLRVIMLTFETGDLWRNDVRFKKPCLPLLAVEQSYNRLAR